MQNHVLKLAGESHKMSDLRRSNKPMMEKKRRARMNHGLNQLKSLILEAMNKDPTHQSRMEKADIVELTVAYLKSLKQEKQSSITNRFKMGFKECTKEVSRYLASCKSLDSSMYRHLLNHLHGHLSNMEGRPVTLEVLGHFLNSTPQYSFTITPVLQSQQEPINLSTSTEPMDLRRSTSESSVYSNEYEDKPVALIVPQGSSSPMSASSLSPSDDDKEPWRPW